MAYRDLSKQICATGFRVKQVIYPGVDYDTVFQSLGSFTV